MPHPSRNDVACLPRQFRFVHHLVPRKNIRPGSFRFQTEFRGSTVRPTMPRAPKSHPPQAHPPAKARRSRPMIHGSPAVGPARVPGLPPPHRWPTCRRPMPPRWRKSNATSGKPGFAPSSPPTPSSSRPTGRPEKSSSPGSRKPHGEPRSSTALPPIFRQNSRT